ncbi:Threonine--tRNA ligase 2 [Koleobacter methoxysyntrophicus]|jgi:threonyl-tRNA synthetase|uniref:Threonine--tRNA ligase n=1 Tax=Koleobacter methoxysyntrophicus TaxID=2751313 RepID=A0A8A0RQY7_9FIRM|nr:threonine--tRNA ligase [Koleobacter methoxysyntrophicus]MDI3540477.1 threonyl-tRNA synthetase [Thermosediminibacterales bacterium]QSQ09948.1 Threonine--tRNA ligase 2 [Koleobacter methoxysyntrophicus]
MSYVRVTLKDGSIKEYPRNITAVDIANSISRGLAKKAIAAKINGKLVDLRTPIKEDCRLEILSFEDEEGKHVYRHSTAHILAQAVKRLYPNTKLGIGPSIEDGFYYDFDREESFTTHDLEKIEDEMRAIIKEDIPFEKMVVRREEAIKILEDMGEKYKVELVKGLPEDAEISFYKQGSFIDLCAGPHVTSTGKIKAFKLMSVAGAYWRGDEKNKMLQRIYGTAFNKKEELENYLHRIEEAKKRDHRKLGKELDLFSLHEEGPGFPFFHPKGMIIRNILEDFWRREHKKRGYQEVKTPIILHENLWKQSGHWDHYKENMYFTTIDDEGYAVKPMNCPGGMLLYKRKMHSYRELPLRLAELGLVHRHELSGVLHGLMRVRCFTQDDAHIFMLPSQITEEIIGVIDLVDYFYKIFGFNYRVELSTRPENSMGSDEMWEKATNALKEALDIKGIDYKVNEGDGAFYGPKIDFHLEDSIGRTWQCGTIQLDFQMPERFDLTYIGQDGEKHRPVMIHRVIFGSIERFIGILIEHFAGAFPLWLAPVQVKVIPITDKHHEYANKVANMLEQKDIRVEVDYRNEKVGYKIREAQLEKIPYMLIVGDKEEAEGTVSIRARKEGDIGTERMDSFINKLMNEIADKSNLS